MTNFAQPTADDVAVAIVASCRETGDDPMSTASGGLGIGRATNRARHYALHALIHVFPVANRYRVCRWVGCPGKEAAFWNASWHQVVRPRASGMGHMANWWDEEAYDRVIRAIEAARTARAVGANSPKVKLSADVGGYVSADRPGVQPEKQRLQDMLAEAAANTAKLNPG